MIADWLPKPSGIFMIADCWPRLVCVCSTSRSIDKCLCPETFWYVIKATVTEYVPRIHRSFGTTLPAGPHWESVAHFRLQWRRKLIRLSGSTNLCRTWDKHGYSCTRSLARSLRKTLDSSSKHCCAGLQHSHRIPLRTWLHQEAHWNMCKLFCMTY
jgi:hypothetical protein